MEEEAVLEVTLSRIRAVHDVLHSANVFVPFNDSVGEVALGAFNRSGDRGLPVLRVGVRELPFRDPGAGPTGHVRKHLEDPDQRVRIVVGQRHVAESQAIGLAFVATAVAEVHDLQDPLGQLAEAANVLGEDHPDPKKALLKLLAAELADGVTRGHVTDLVAKDAGELRLGRELCQDAASQVDEPARDGERVDCRIVHDAERPREVRSLGRLGQALAEVVYIVTELLVGVNPHRRRDLRVVFAAHLDFLCLGDERELPLPGGWIHGAAGHDHRACQADDGPRVPLHSHLTDPAMGSGACRRGP